jgi:hypothetical protein
MYVGVCRLDLRVHASHSLKEKRRVARAVSERVRNKFGASVAEVAAQDKWQLGVLGISVVSGSAAHAREQVDAIIRYVTEFAVEAEVSVSGLEVFNYED